MPVIDNAAIRFFDGFEYVITSGINYHREGPKHLKLDRFKLNTISLVEYSNRPKSLTVFAPEEKCEVPSDVGVKMVYQFKSDEGANIGKEEWILLPFVFTQYPRRRWVIDIPDGAVVVEITFVDEKVTYLNGDPDGYHLLMSDGIRQGHIMRGLNPYAVILF